MTYSIGNKNQFHSSWEAQVGEACSDRFCDKNGKASNLGFLSFLKLVINWC